MTHSRGLGRFASLSFALVLLAACAGQREPAQTMMSEIEAAAAAAATDAAKYVPDRLNDVQTKLDDLKTAFNAQDYQGVLARGPALLSEAQGLAGAAAAKKAQREKELNEQWNALAISVPDELTTIHHRLDMLGPSKNRRLARGVDFEAAHTGFDEAASLWSKAQGAFGNGNLDEAVLAGNGAKSKLAAAAGALQVELPGATGTAPATAPAVPR